MQKYVCDICGYIYDPEVGDPDSGVAPGTAFEDIPDDWVCPLCGVSKEDFSPEDQKTTIKKSLALFFMSSIGYNKKYNETRRIYGSKSTGNP